MRRRKLVKLLDATEQRLTGNWTQGTFGTVGGPVCLMGAIHVAVGAHPEGINLTKRKERQVRAVVATIEPCLRLPTTYPFNRVSTFNDLRSTREADVIAVLHCAKERA